MDITATVKFRAQTCSVCGIAFLVTECFEEVRRREGRKFYCPNGHWMRFIDGYLARKEAEAPDFERRRERLLHLHQLEQAEAKAAEAEEKLLAMQKMVGNHTTAAGPTADVAAHRRQQHRRPQPARD